jgi:hypothetical protein
MKDQTVITESVQRDSELSTDKAPQFVEVQIHKSIITCIVDVTGEIYVPIKPICDAIGIHAESALRSIKNDPILGDNHTVRLGYDTLGRQKQMYYLPIHMLNGWLFGIDVSKVKGSGKEALILYKRDCYRILFNHFFGKYRQLETALHEKQSLKNEIHVLYQEKYQCEKRIKQLKARVELIESNLYTGQLQLKAGGN